MLGRVTVVLALTLAVSGCTGVDARLRTPAVSLPTADASSAAQPVATRTAVPSVTPSIAVPPSSVEPRSCTPPPTVQVLGGWSPSWPLADLVACTGSRELAVVGYVAPSWGIGGPSNGLVPTWLGEWQGLPSVLWAKPHPADGCLAADDCVWMFLFAANPAALPLAPDRWVAVTGHLDDPTARTCRWAGRGDAITPSRAVEICRAHFVVTGIADGPPPSQLP
jgi:hypothetical protein